jgi:hypothetical protein
MRRTIVICLLGAAGAVLAMAATSQPAGRPGATTTTRQAEASEWKVGTRVLLTPGWVVAVVEMNPTGRAPAVAGEVTYIGMSRKTGKCIRLGGCTWHTKAPDGTPGVYLGWIFRNDNVTYMVGDDVDTGHLTVTDGSKVLVDEAGVWQPQQPR